MSDDTKMTFGKLNRDMLDAERGKSLSQVLADLGVHPKESHFQRADLAVTAKDTKEAYFQLADAVRKTADPQQRVAMLSSSTWPRGMFFPS